MAVKKAPGRPKVSCTPSGGLPQGRAGGADKVAIYGITALRYAGAQLVEAMMGLIDSSQGRWDLRPAPTRVNEVVDRLVEGDTVISLFPDEAGRLHPGPEVKVDVLPEGIETLALAEEEPGRQLRDLPRF